jgi:ferredoxin--NADP+ reductase
MKIINKVVLFPTDPGRIVQMRIACPHIAQKVLPGQFIILMVRESSERIPLTVVANDQDTITIIFQEAGYSTKLLGAMVVGEELYSITGPLGHPTPLKNYGNIIVVGGGVGIAEILPVAKALKEAGNVVVSVLGARNKDLLILADEIKAVSDRVYFVTDDGSFGEKGFVSDVLSRILKDNPAYSLVYCVGPVPMMRVVSAITKPYGIKTLVCLNAIMLDGTGMCGSCRLTEDKKVKFCCVDGPDFDGHLVDFDELSARQKRFVSEERVSLEKLNKCKCNER